MPVRHAQRLVTAAAFVLAAQALASDRIGRAEADQPKYVEVVNGPDKPIMMEGLIAGTVDIAKLPPVECVQSGAWTIQLDEASQCACGPQEVLSSPEQPLYVRPVGQPVRDPISTRVADPTYHSVFLDGPGDLTITSIDVPAGKRFVVEHVIASVAARNAGAFGSNIAGALLYVRPPEGGYEQVLDLPLTHQGEVDPGYQLFAINQPLKLVIQPGRQLVLVGRQRGGANQVGRGTITGYFEDL